MGKCVTPVMFTCHMYSFHCARTMSRKGGILVPHTVQSRAPKNHVAFVANSMLFTSLTEVLGTRGTAVRRPLTTARLWAPIRKRSRIRMQRTLERVHQRGPWPVQMLWACQATGGMYIGGIHWHWRR